MNKLIISIVTSTSILALSAGSLCASTKSWLDNDNNVTAPAAPEVNAPRVKAESRTLDDSLKLACEQDRDTFMNFNDLDMKVVRELRLEFDGTFPRTNAHIATVHFQTLVPLLLQFQSFINTYKEQTPTASQQTLDVIEDINDDIAHLLKPKRTTQKPMVLLPFFFDLHNRFIASLSNPSEDEKSVFLHAVHPEYLLGMFENNAWQTPMKAFVEIEEFDNKGKEVEIHIDAPNISKEIFDLVENMLRFQLGPKIHYPMYGQDKLGIPFLTLKAIQRIYPFAFQPEKTVGAHGVDDASPAGLSAHDFVHAELDPRVKMLKKHILEIVNKKYLDAVAGDLEFDAETIARTYAPVAIERFQKIEQIFEQFFGHLVKEVLPNHGLVEFKKVMAGFFWVMREQVGFNPDLFGPMSFQAVIDSYVDKSLSKLNDQDESWEVTYNPLITCPVDGKSPYTLDGIIDTIKAKFKLEEDHGRIINADVAYAPAGECVKARFIDVHFKFASGYEKTISFTTMYHRMKNIEDARGLLNWAGLEMAEAPKLEGLSREDALAQATAYIDGVRGKLEEMINLFRESFKRYVAPEIDAEYQASTAQAEAQVNEQLPIPNNDDVIKAQLESQQEQGRLLQELHAANLAAQLDALEKSQLELLKFNAEIDAAKAAESARLAAMDKEYQETKYGIQTELANEQATRNANLAALKALLVEKFEKL